MSPLRRLSAIVGLVARVGAVGDRIERLGAPGFVAALAELAGDAARGVTVADVDAMLACALFFLRGGASRIAPLLAAARSAENELVLTMLEEGPAQKALSRRGRLRDQGPPRKVERERWMRTPSSAEHRRMFGDEPWPDWLLGPQPGEDDYPAGRELVRRPPAHVAMQVRQLTFHNDPAVIRTFLRDRAVALRDVVKLAARRPTMPALVDEIVQHDGWVARAEVRSALVENPFTPTKTALLLLPTCRGSCREVGKAAVHPRLRELAALLARSGDDALARGRQHRPRR